MAPRITLTIINGPAQGTEYIFDAPCEKVIGRADDCTLQLPSSLVFADVSRHHCVLQIDPPAVHVKDLGSLNGTFINGDMIGKRLGNEMRKEGSTLTSTAHELKGGDELKVGSVVFRVSVADGTELPLPVYFASAFQ